MQVIDPITFLNTNPSSLREVKPKETAKKEEKSDSAMASLKSLIAKDRAAFSYNIQGDLEELSQSYKVLYKQVKSQMERYFGVTGQDPNSEEAKKYLPPEDASAQDILDFYSPQNTAQRIVSFTTGFLGNYLDNHKDREDAENIDKFTTLITDAVKKGFSEAAVVLGNIEKVQDGEIAKNIQRTYEMALEGINQFRIDYLRRVDAKTVDPEVLEDESQSILHTSETDTTLIPEEAPLDPTQ